MKGKLGILVVLSLLSWVMRPGMAVLFESTGDPSYNTNAPSGSLTNSGWQYEGQWGVFLGTAIAPTFFLAAQHVGGSTGDVFALNGINYHAVASFDCPGTDLRVWQVAETFPNYAPLYTKSNEVGKTLIVIGRGTQRDTPVMVSGKTNGWNWGAHDNVERWGENVVSGIYTDANVGQLLRAAFDKPGITNECHLSNGDSSGGLFIEDGTTWKLAAINYSVDGDFSFDGTSNTEFIAAMMDLRGLYVGGGTNWTLIPTNASSAYPSSFYCSRVSANISWINSVINFEPGIDLCIDAVQIVGPDVQISLCTGSNRLYRVDHSSDLVTGVWTTVTNNIPGTGGTVPVIDPGAASLPKQFYRATILQ